MLMPKDPPSQGGIVSLQRAPQLGCTFLFGGHRPWLRSPVSGLAPRSETSVIVHGMRGGVGTPPIRGTGPMGDEVSKESRPLLNP